jgi:drug/metabolite transporter (DMT)-like permease
LPYFTGVLRMYLAVAAAPPIMLTSRAMPYSSPSHAGSSRLVSYFYLFSAMSIVGSYVALSKPLVVAFPIFVLATIRFMIAAVAMVPWTLPQPSDLPLGATEKRVLFAQSFFGNFLFSICMLYGVSMTSASAAGVIFATIPAMVAVFSRIYLKEALTRRTLFAIGLSVSGLVVLQFAKGEAGAHGAALGTAGGGMQTGVSLLGNMLIFGAVCCEAIYVVLGKQLMSTVSPTRVSATINLIGLALILPFGIWQGVGFAARDGFAAVTVSAWLLLVYYALAASVFSVWLWMKGLQSVPASQAGVFTLALPLTATAIGVLFFGETFTAVHAIAFALAIAGLVLIVTAQSLPKSPAA